MSDVSADLAAAETKLQRAQALVAELERDLPPKPPEPEDDGPGPMLPGETFDQFMARGMQHFFGKMAIASQNVESIKRSIDIGHYDYAVKLMKGWYAREPHQVEVLRGLKAYLLAKRRQRRAMQASWARAHRAKKRKARIAADTRTCNVCGKSMAGKRAKALTCSDACRMRKSRKIAALNTPG